MRWLATTRSMVCRTSVQRRSLARESHIEDVIPERRVGAEINLYRRAAALNVMSKIDLARLA